MFKSRSDHQLDLFKVVPGSTLQGCACTKPTGLPRASWDSEPVKFIPVVYFIGPEKPQRGEDNNIIMYVCIVSTMEQANLDILK